MKKLILVLTLGFGLWTLDGFGATYYVSKAGSNSHACSTTDSAATNKLTLSGSTGGIQCLQSGDTLQIHAGTYTEIPDANTTLFRSGTSWSNLTTIMAYPGEVVTVNGSFNIAVSSLNPTLKYLLLSGFKVVVPTTVDVGISLYTGSTVPFPNMFVRLSNVEIVNAGGPSEGANKGNCGQGVQVHASSNELLNVTVHDAYSACQYVHGFYINGHDNLIDHAIVYNMSGYGLQVYNSAGGADNNTVRNSLVYNNGFSTIQNSGGISLYSGTGSAAYNNVTYGNATHGIVIGGSGVNVKIYNNTVNNANGGLNILQGATNPTIQNNIMYPFGINDQGHSGGTIDHNLTTNPNWVNSTTHDYHLQASSTGARDTGVTVATFNTDYDGVTRPFGSAYDIGAYEYFSPDSTPPVISSISATGLGDTAANITWTTNESADSQIQYGLTTSYGTTTTLDTALVTSHLVALTGLSQGTLYHYKVISKDASTNSSSSSDQTFTTTSTPFVSTIAITNPAPGVSFLTGTTQPIRWTTDDPGNLKIEISRDNGTTYSTVTASILGSSQGYDYVVDPPASSQVLFKISSLSYSGVATLAGVMRVGGNYSK